VCLIVCVITEIPKETLCSSGNLKENEDDHDDDDSCHMGRTLERQHVLDLPEGLTFRLCPDMVCRDLLTFSGKH
jgi:hypothetical protein